MNAGSITWITMAIATMDIAMAIMPMGTTLDRARARARVDLPSLQVAPARRAAPPLRAARRPRAARLRPAVGRRLPAAQLLAATDLFICDSLVPASPRR